MYIGIYVMRLAAAINNNNVYVRQTCFGRILPAIVIGIEVNHTANVYHITVYTEVVTAVSTAMSINIISMSRIAAGIG